MSDYLEFRLLKYILAVADTLNFTRAAQRLFLAQPSLSKQIRDLEIDIKFPLFERSRDGIRVTNAGRIVIAYASNTLRERDEMLSMARAVHLGEIPRLRLGFSSFINPSLLQTFRQSYEEMFPGCEIQLAGGDPMLILQKLSQRRLDCAVLPMPIDAGVYNVQQIAQSPLAVCMRSDDTLANRALLDIQELADRIKIFRDPELHPLAHARLVEMFSDVGIPLHLEHSARTSSDIQWMVKAGYGLALVDQHSTLESGLITRPIAGVNWTTDTAFVHQSRADHIALPFIERVMQEDWKNLHRKKPTSSTIRPEQLKLLI